MPVSHELHGSRPEGWPIPPPGLNARTETRSRVPCETCGKPAFQDPPCEVRDSAGNLLRVERKITCLDCSKTERSWKRHVRRPKPEPKEEPMAVAPVQDIKTCPCGCREPLLPGRQYAGRGCVGRARKGKPLAPEVLARRAARAAEEKEARSQRMAEAVPPPDAVIRRYARAEPPVIPACDCGSLDASCGCIALTGSSLPEGFQMIPYDPDWFHRPPLEVRDRYAIVADLAREHDPKTLRAAADLREAIQAMTNIEEGKCT